MATSVGALLGVIPIAAIAIFLVWLVVFNNSLRIAGFNLSRPCLADRRCGFSLVCDTHGPMLFYFHAWHDGTRRLAASV